MRKQLIGALAALGVVAVSGVASAADTFMTGDVMASVGAGNYQQWRKVGAIWTLIDTLMTGTGSTETTGSAFDKFGNFYGTNYTVSSTSKFLGAGTPHTHSLWATNDAGAHNESILFDAAGNVYQGQSDGTADIIKRSAAGAFIARFNVALEARGSDWIDLASDQKTMFYTSEGRLIKRYDVSTDTQLADFATLPGSGTAFGFRLLSDGGLLVADRFNIKRLNAAGTVVQTYDAAGVDLWFALNLDPDGTTFWSANFANHVYRFNIATGALVDDFATTGSQVSGLSVFGEITQATAAPLPPSAWMGLTMLAGVALVGYRRRRLALN